MIKKSNERRHFFFAGGGGLAHYYKNILKFRNSNRCTVKMKHKNLNWIGIKQIIFHNLIVKYSDFIFFCIIDICSL